MRKYAAEFIGVFILVFAGAGAILADSYLGKVAVVDSYGPLGVALANGLALAVAIAATIHISGGHINPAISISFWVARRLPAGDMIGYVVAQLLGGTAAGFLLKAIVPGETFEFVSGGVPALSPGEIGVAQGAAIEVVLTFFLGFVIWAVAVDRRGARNLAPFAIGLTLAFAVIVGGPFTGAALNPARWLGPALASGTFDNAIVWTAGPLLGALVASLLYETFLMPAEDEEDLAAWLEEEEEEDEEEEEERAFAAAQRADQTSFTSPASPPPAPPTPAAPPPPPPRPEREQEGWSPPPPPPPE